MKLAEDLPSASVSLFPQPYVHVTIFGLNGAIERVHLSFNPQGFSFETVGLENNLCDQVLIWLSQYGQKKQLTDLPLSLASLTPFAKKVLEAAKHIPMGKTMNYAELANRIGSKKQARAVGNALHHNPYPLFVPCHRIISSSGDLGGFAFESSIKQSLLNFEQNHS